MRKVWLWVFVLLFLVGVPVFGANESGHVELNSEGYPYILVEDHADLTAWNATLIAATTCDGMPCFNATGGTAWFGNTSYLNNTMVSVRYMYKEYAAARYQYNALGQNSRDVNKNMMYMATGVAGVDTNIQKDNTPTDQKQRDYDWTAVVWHDICMQWGPNNGSIYDNGTLVLNSTWSVAQDISLLPYIVFRSDNPANSWAKLRAWYGFCDDEPTNATFSTDLIINGIDDFTSGSINVFTAKVEWSNGTTTDYDTANGTVSLLELGPTTLYANVTFYNATDYFNLTRSVTVSANVTNTVNMRAFQAVACFNATQKVSEVSVVADNYTAGSVVRTECFNITAGSHNVMFSKVGWFTVNRTLAIAALSNATYTVGNVSSGLVNVTAYYSNGTVLTGWDIDLYSSTVPSWVGESGGDTGGSYLFYAINGTYVAWLNSSEGNESFSFVVDQAYENVSYFYFSLDNCSNTSVPVLQFDLRYEFDESLLNDSVLNAWFNVSSSAYAGYRTFNVSYSLGNYYRVCISNNSVSNFTAYAQMVYSNLPDFAEKNYYLVDYALNSSSMAVIDLFLTNGTTQVNLQVRDYVDDPISDVFIKVLSYDVGTNTYKTTEIVKTDSEGDAYAQIVLSTEWYAFLLEYEGEVVLQTLPTKITSTTRTFRVDFGDEFLSNYAIVEDISTSLTYTNATTTFSFTYSDPSNTMQQGCLVLRKRTINGDVVVNQSCENSAAATVLLSIPGSVDVGASYVGSASVVVGGIEFPAGSLSVGFDDRYKVFGLSGVFFSALIIFTLVLVGLWHPLACVVLGLVGFVACLLLGLVYFSWSVVVAVIITGGIAVWRSARS